MWPFPSLGIQKVARPTFLFLTELGWRTRVHVPVMVATLCFITGIRMELDISLLVATIRNRLSRQLTDDDDDDNLLMDDISDDSDDVTNDHMSLYSNFDSFDGDYTDYFEEDEDSDEDDDDDDYNEGDLYNNGVIDEDMVTNQMPNDRPQITNHQWIGNCPSTIVA